MGVKATFSFHFRTQIFFLDWKIEVKLLSFIQLKSNQFQKNILMVTDELMIKGTIISCWIFFNNCKKKRKKTTK